MHSIEYVTDEHGRKKSVLISLEDYERLLEDMSDLAAVAERRTESTISHEAFLAELKKDGVLSD